MSVTTPPRHLADIEAILVTARQEGLEVGRDDIIDIAGAPTIDGIPAALWVALMLDPTD